ncbi:MAG: hypothetical protein IKK06_08860 [Clostridia bacterium]|nr:hypothetical protein [Clostridia bacterium]
MTFKTEKGQLAYQFLTGITICLWVWFFLLTVAVAFLPSMDTSGDILGFSPPTAALLMACFFAPALAALLAVIRLIRRVVRLKRRGTEHRTRSVVLLCLESVALFCSLGAFLQFYFDGLDEPGLMFGCLGVLILLGIAVFHHFVKEEKPIYTVKLYKKKWSVILLVLLALFPVFIPVNTEPHVFYGGLAHDGKEYHAIAYSVAVRTVEDEVVDWNIAVFPFNYDEETYKKLDNFE